MPYGTINADLMTTSDGVSSSGLYGFKNRIINGAMVIDQRNAGASVTPASASYVLDRWSLYPTQASKLSVQQSTTVPAGFVNSTVITSLSAYSVVAGDFFAYGQRIEGFNVADFGFGTASASTVTLSFWVRSSLTGTFGGSLVNGAATRSYPFTYTISVANTFEYKTITIAGDTSGTWITNNGIGLVLFLGLGVGSTYSGTAGSWSSNYYFSATGATSVVGTNGATFYITGVQLEKGSTATSFDYRPFGTELALCQRYYTQFGVTSAYEHYAIGVAQTGGVTCIMNLPVTMRAAPTFAVAGTVSTSYNIFDGSSQGSITAIAADVMSLNVCSSFVTASGLTTGRACRWYRTASALATVSYTAEL